jgi:L-threonylcarbamoyladenylate synthase
MRVLKINSEQIDQELIEEAASVIRNGGLVIFPTETVYGLAANALDTNAVRRVFDAKRRPLTAPLPIQVGDKTLLAEVTDELSDVALSLAERYMPGPITLVVSKGPGVSDLVSSGGKTVGVRIPDDPVALALLRAVGGPIVATSANLSEQNAPTSADEAIRQIGDWVDIVLDAGPCKHGVASTVIDTTVSPPRIVRQGAISGEEIRKVIGDLFE